MPARIRPAGARGEGWATDGTRTRDNLNHNQGLYQLSYGHRLRDRKSRERGLRFKSKDAGVGGPGADGEERRWD